MGFNSGFKGLCTPVYCIYASSLQILLKGKSSYPTVKGKKLQTIPDKNINCRKIWLLQKCNISVREFKTGNVGVT